MTTTVTAVAHRGDPYRARENTLPSIRSAVDRGADAVEIDVRVTRDKVPVLLHDSTLERLWGHDVRLDRLEQRELAERTGGGVPTLRQALSAAGDRRVMLDLPGATDNSVRETVAVVRECGAQDRVYYCADTHAMLKVRAADPSAEIALTWTTLAPPRSVLLDAVRPRWLNYRFGLLSRELADRVHADGLLVSAWTVDTRRTMRRLLAYGVDSITSNRIDALRKQLANSPVPEAP
ncbi:MULTISPECIES: glycerophosphodiester phosphodiesterase [Streptomyces]|uniref:Glycerophosphodiester phosphodiesterase n=1 Tax=Streptomyces glycanivorans TaxID=3033808 RepID=A0ABY9J7U0_9ACTN|nr:MULTISPECIES: glycerophosphodiester phosphodiesterase [unclassified Streptomyces]WSQ77249.1 glycerophosphodiester phosphodiesterase [Streptomyces sp. NBC_01213]TXS18326.1 glycerophosphodiester phosphodiesterase [Streptomyces sp. wa22]WLQ63861.1 glycerophosphodiester phosphodiesterase [Streptomyces sp. Alt3]WSQ84580.1 glycerophosphodiester phosphodiesterase [Streptomyces sp. NBC_01212]WSR09307.1 glycerophosphodiester phosphodiesterase [Streptomyces sp. NBC_01208]